MPKLSCFIIIATAVILLFAPLQVNAYPFAAENESAGGSALEIRVSKSLLDYTDSYVLYAFKKGGDYADYEGFLDVKSQYCDTSGRCEQPSVVEWRNRELKKGKYYEKILNFKPGIYKAQFKPKGGKWRGENYNWSNQVALFVGRNEFLSRTEAEREGLGLFDAGKFWNLEKGYPAVFKGINYDWDPVKPFRTYFSVEKTNVCGEDTYTMYITKEDTAGYWGPEGSHGYWKKDHNVKFDLVNFKEGDGWHDEYLTAIGERKPYFVAGRILDPQRAFAEGIPNHFMMHVGSLANSSFLGVPDKFPGYALSPRWVASGYGISVLQRNIAANPITQMNIPYKTSEPYNSSYNLEQEEKTYCRWFRGNNFNDPADRPVDELWSVTVDFIDSSRLTDNENKPTKLAGSGKKVMQVRYYETRSDFKTTTNPQQDGVAREDWYFAKDIGLVKITQKPYSSSQNNPTGPCKGNAECIGSEIRNFTKGKPGVVLTRYSILERTAGDANGDAAVDSQDAEYIFAKYGSSNGSGVSIMSDPLDDLVPVADFNGDKKVNGFDYVSVLESLNR